jgi:hypothetical protein
MPTPSSCHDPSPVIAATIPDQHCSITPNHPSARFPISMFPPATHSGHNPAVLQQSLAAAMLSGHSLQQIQQLCRPETATSSMLHAMFNTDICGLFMVDFNPHALSSMRHVSQLVEQLFRQTTHQNDTCPIINTCCWCMCAVHSSGCWFDRC